MRASPAKSEKRPPASSTITCTAARSQLGQSSCAVDGAVGGAFADEHVPPEVAQSARVPGAGGDCLEPGVEGKAEHGILDLRDRRYMHALTVYERASATLGPPAPPERRRRHHADPDHAGLFQCDERRPRGDPACVAPRAVDRIEDPATRGVARGPELLPENRVSRASLGEQAAKLGLDLAVRLRDRCQVGLRLDRELRAKARE